MLADCDKGLKPGKVADKYTVSPAWVYRLLQRRRQTGKTRPRKGRPGPKPMLQPDVVVMDNLSCHTQLTVRQAIEAAGCRVLYQPPYSPDYNPIELAFSKLKGGSADRRGTVGDARLATRAVRPRGARRLLPAPRLRLYTILKNLLGYCASIFRDAVRRKVLAENPFESLKKPAADNRDRQAYVPVEIVERLIAEQAPNAEWRLLLAMARYLGVRAPSEPFSMTWDCVDWSKQRIRIPSLKTAVHGKAFRVMPILPQVKPYLEAAFEQAPEGTTYIFHQLRQRDSVKAAEKGFWMNLNLRQQLTRMLSRGDSTLAAPLAQPESQCPNRPSQLFPGSCCV